MIIWLALLIPLISVPIIYWKFQRSITWWEILIQLFVPVIFVLLSQVLIEHIQTTATEYWGGWAVSSEYYEPWNERVMCRHPKYRTVHDGKGRSHQVFDGYQHMYDVDYHPAYWVILDSNGLTLQTSRDNFERLCGQWSNRTFVDLHRSYHTIDGDKYATKWIEGTVIDPIVTTHSYENRVAASNSVFNFQKVDPKKLQLFDYPPVDDYYHQKCILGITDETAEFRLQCQNAILGTTKQAKVFILVFNDRPMQAAMDQEAYWKRGNKNEFVVCIGTKQNEVQWSYVFSWTDVELLKIEARNLLINQKTLNLNAFINELVPLMREKWERKHFRDFNYLSIEPPGWAIGLVFVLTLLVSAGVSMWCVMNDFGTPLEVWNRRKSWRR